MREKRAAACARALAGAGALARWALAAYALWRWADWGWGLAAGAQGLGVAAAWVAMGRSAGDGQAQREGADGSPEQEAFWAPKWARAKAALVASLACEPALLLSAAPGGWLRAELLWAAALCAIALAAHAAAFAARRRGARQWHEMAEREMLSGTPSPAAWQAALDESAGRLDAAREAYATRRARELREAHDAQIGRQESAPSQRAWAWLGAALILFYGSWAIAHWRMEALRGEIPGAAAMAAPTGLFCATKSDFKRKDA
jgi:hypothetical protein